MKFQLEEDASDGDTLWSDHEFNKKSRDLVTGEEKESNECDGFIHEEKKSDEGDGFIHIKKNADPFNGVAAILSFDIDTDALNCTSSKRPQADVDSMDELMNGLDLSFHNFLLSGDERDDASNTATNPPPKCNCASRKTDKRHAETVKLQEILQANFGWNHPNSDTKHAKGRAKPPNGLKEKMNMLPGHLKSLMVNFGRIERVHSK